MVDYIFESTKN